MAYLSPFLTLMVGALKKASGSLARDFNELEHLQSATHRDSMFATRAFERTERILREELNKIKADYPVLVGDFANIPVSGNCFLLCPIDGFANFAHANANFAISAAMLENNIVVAGAIYNPITDEMFFAEKGSGAFKEGFRNHERLRVSGNKQTEKSLLACEAEIDLLQKAYKISSNILISGSVVLDLAYLASGKTDALIAANANPSQLAAGVLLVKESGGYVFEIGNTDTRSENLNKVIFGGNIMATNEAMKQKIAEMIA